ncbi:MAG: hypothetical protein RSD47_11650 [Romboutsia sp.]
MLAINATQHRQNYSMYYDKTIRTGPIFVKRLRDYAVQMDISLLKTLIEDVENISVTCEKETDGSIVLTTDIFDLIAVGNTIEEANTNMIAELKDYALDFIENLNEWSKAPNRKKHVKYIMKIATCENDQEILDMIRID